MQDSYPLTRAAYAHADARRALTHPRHPVLRQMFGISGTGGSVGRITGVETNPSLWSLAARARQFRQMLMTDPRVAQGWGARAQTMMSGRRTVDPTGDTELHMQGAALCAEVVGLHTEGAEARWSPLMGESFDAVLRRQIMAEFYGCKYQEVMWDLRWSHARRRISTVPVKIDDRDLTAHERWYLDPEDHGTLLGVHQRTVGGEVNPLPIPVSKLLYTAVGVEGSNYDGIGRARAAWWNVTAKAGTLDALLVGVDKWSVPTAKVEVDYRLAEEHNVPDTELQKQVDAAFEQAQLYRSGGESALKDTEYCKFTECGDGVLDASSPIKAAEFFDSQIMAVFGTQGLNLGLSDPGAKSVGEVHDKAFLRSVLDFLDAIVDTFGRLFAQIMRYNFGAGSEAYAPRLAFRGLDVSVLTQILPMLPQLGQADTANRAAGGPGFLTAEIGQAISSHLLDMLGTRGGSSQ